MPKRVAVSNNAIHQELPKLVYLGTVRTSTPLSKDRALHREGHSIVIGVLADWAK